MGDLKDDEKITWSNLVTFKCYNNTLTNVFWDEEKYLNMFFLSVFKKGNKVRTKHKN